MELFERAARGKWRFESNRGLLNAENLFDMPLTSNDGFDLNSIAVTIDDQLDRTNKKSFVEPVKSTGRAELEGKLELVKVVIARKLADRKAAETRAANSEKRRKLLDALAKREDAALSEASQEELLAQLAELEEATAAE